MNGFERTPLQRKEFLRRLSSRPETQNATIEIKNLLADNPVTSISMLQVADILNRYQVGFSELRPEFVEIVHHIPRHALLQCAEGKALPRSAYDDIDHLKTSLNCQSTCRSTKRRGHYFSDSNLPAGIVWG